MHWLGTRVTKDPGRAVIIPPTAPGSFGDDAALRSLVEQLARASVTRITILECLAGSLWQDEPKYRNVDSLRMGAFFGRGLWKHLLFGTLGVELIRTVFTLARAGRTYIMGADIMDGFYGPGKTLRRLWIARLAADLGSTVSITGFSWNDKADPRIARELRKLSDRIAVHLRDELSLSRLRRDAPGIRADLTADPAFLLKPSESSGTLATIEAWIIRQRSAGRTVIAVNFASHLLGVGKLPSDGAGFTKRVVSGILSAAPEASLLFIPHDRRSNPSDFDLAAIAIQGLESRMADRAIMLPSTVDASEAKAAVAWADVLISQRMHLAIAAVGQVVPVACIVYQGKFEGLFRHFSIEDVTLSPDDATEDRIADLVRRLLGRREELRRQIAGRLPVVTQMALGNL